MARNYGERSGGSLIMIVVGVLAVAVIAGAGLLIWHGNVEADQKEAASWTVDGPPCPTIGAAAFKQLENQPASPFDFRGLHGEMTNGTVNCEIIDYDHGRKTASFPVCQFAAAYGLHVAGPKGDLYFAPGVGHTTNLSLAGGNVRCVLGARASDDS